MKRFNISEYAIMGTKVVQVSKKLQNGNVLVLYSKDEPDWEGSCSHLYKKVVKGYSLHKFTKRNLVRYLELTPFDLGALGF